MLANLACALAPQNPVAMRAGDRVAAPPPRPAQSLENVCMFKEIDPRATHAVLNSDEPVIYLDVRSRAEFAAGHVPGSLNIPLLEPNGDGMMAPNPDFARIVDATVPRDVRIIVGCKSGGRSARAAEFMAASGWCDVSNMIGGMYGLHGMLGAPEQAGWAECGLPVTTTPEPGCTYDELHERANAQAKG
jgi:rhodanese-related sulfurtransferase